MVVEVVNEGLKDYRSWLRLVDCGQESLSGRKSPLVAVKARVADVGERMTVAVPSESFVWWWCYYILYSNKHVSLMTRNITTKGQNKFCSYHKKTRKKSPIQILKIYFSSFPVDVNETILNKLMENCKQYTSPLPVGTFVVIVTKFIGL